MLIDQPLEVLAEEADDEGERQEDRRHHGQLLGDLVEPVGDDREIGVAAAGEQVAVGVDLVGDPDRVVVDVAEVVARVGFEAGDFEDVVDPAGEQVALRGDHPAQRDQLAAQRGDLLQLARVGPVEDLAVEPFHAVVEPLEDREEGVGEAVEHPVDDELLRARRLRVEAARALPPAPRRAARAR